MPQLFARFAWALLPYASPFLIGSARYLSIRRNGLFSVREFAADKLFELVARSKSRSRSPTKRKASLAPVDSEGEGQGEGEDEESCEHVEESTRGRKRRRTGEELLPTPPREVV
ncbi:MAG: hypothetical protein M1829_002984 [Trizodia sp. TS-e1964]|nr:MAG: hypothetical protein M1829_002984 [Trizodia sp. TS-e1964]